jgi:hypothetical protein
MKIYDNALQAKIAARNEVNAIANARFADAVAALQPFVGQKVCKVDGSLLAKVEKALTPTEGGRGGEPHTWYSTGHGYSVTLNVKVCTSARTKGDYQIAHYAEDTIYLGDLSNGVLTRLYDAPNRRTDYSEDFVRAARLEVEKADKAKREAESKVHYFGLYD